MEESTKSFSDLAEVTTLIRAMWMGPVPPSISEIITPAIRQDPDALAEAIAADMEVRLARQLPARLEDYRIAVPTLLESRAACRAVLMGELAQRSGATSKNPTGESIEVISADLKARFPTLAGEIDTLASLADLLREAAAPNTTQREPGTKLGKYVLEALLGHGAFGSTWQAFDTRLRRHVALKILHHAHMLGQRGAQRLLDEARAAAAIDHESIVRIHEAGQLPQTGEYFIDTQLVGTPVEPTAKVSASPTLESLVRQGPTDPHRASKLIAQAARGVAAAHARGLTHRDIKPANILLSADGRALVADFGLSQWISHPASSSQQTSTAKTSSAKTKTSTAPQSESPSHSSSLASSKPAKFRIAGTPAYMAPEAARGEPITPAADIFSLGATLRALLLGTPPRQPPDPELGDSASQVLALARTTPLPPLSQLAPALASTLCAIADKAVAQLPDDRYASAERFAADLEAFLAFLPTQAAPPSTTGRTLLWMRRNRIAAAISAAALALMIAGSWAFITRLTIERDRAIAAEASAASQRDDAIAARRTIETMNTFLGRTFNSTRGLEGRAEITLAQSLELASKRAGRTFADQPLVEAAVRHFLGQASAGAGYFDKAQEEINRSLELRTKILGENHPDTVSTLRQLAEIYARTNRVKESHDLCRSIVKLLNEPYGEESADSLWAMTSLAAIDIRENRLDAARTTLEHIARQYRRLRLSESPDRQNALNNLVIVYSATGDREKEIAAQKEIIEFNTRLLGPNDISTLNAEQALGWVYRNHNRADDAIAVYRSVLPRYEALVGKGHFAWIHIAIELVLLECKRKPEDALPLAQTLYQQLDALSPSSQYRLRGLAAYGTALAANGQDEAAVPFLKQAFEGNLEYRRPGHPHTSESGTYLARVLDKLQRPDEALAVRERIKSAAAQGTKPQ